MRSRQSAECGGNQDVRYQEFSEMTLDYTKLFRWQETSSQGSFHICAAAIRVMRDRPILCRCGSWDSRCSLSWFLFAPMGRFFVAFLQHVGIIILFLDEKLEKAFRRPAFSRRRILPVGNKGFVSCIKTRQRNVLTAFLGGDATKPLNTAPIRRLNRFIEN